MIKKHNLIIDTPDNNGRDNFIQTVLKYCPYYKVHASPPNYFNDLAGQEGVFPTIDYAIYDNIYNSIQNDLTNIPHIQNGSILKDFIYHKLINPKAKWLDNYEVYMERFLSAKYDESYTYWIMTIKNEYLSDETNKENDKKLKALATVNKEYNYYANLIKAKANKFKFIHSEGFGIMDYIDAMQDCINSSIKIFENNPVYLIDTEYYLNNRHINPIACRDNIKFIFLANDSDTFFKMLNSSNFKYLPKEDYAVIINKSSEIINYDFFIIYMMANILKSRKNILHLTSDLFNVYLNLYLGKQ